MARSGCIAEMAVLTERVTRRYKPRPTDFCSAAIPGQLTCLNSIAAANGGGSPLMTAGEAPAKVGFWALTLGSIGVVYGDIGTSPLYALREAVLAAVGSRQSGERAGRARHAVADHLGAVVRRHRQIRADPAARRQQRRGRHARADGAGVARARARRQRRRSCSASSAARCSMATPSSRRRCRCSRRSKASRS